MQNTSQLADSTVSNISISAPRFLPGYKLVAVLNKPQMFREKKKKTDDKSTFLIGLLPPARATRGRLPRVSSSLPSDRLEPATFTLAEQWMEQQTWIFPARMPAPGTFSTSEASTSRELPQRLPYVFHLSVQASGWRGKQPKNQKAGKLKQPWDSCLVFCQLRPLFLQQWHVGVASQQQPKTSSHCALRLSPYLFIFLSGVFYSWPWLPIGTWGSLGHYF